MDNTEYKYKACYSSCESCDKNGDENNNNCNECVAGFTFIELEKDKNCYLKCEFYYYFDSNGKYSCTKEGKCPDEYNKLIIDKKKCVNNCSTDLIYKYEYNNSCFLSCPNGTHQSSYDNYFCEADLKCGKYYNYDHTGCLEEIPEGYYMNNSHLKTIDKCNIKCKNCSLESNNYNLCISCNINENYYPKYNDELSINSFIECYDESFDGYILDNNMYKPCYYTCKNCTEIGNEFDNKCISCKNNYSFKDDFENDSNCYKNCQYNYYFDLNRAYYCTNEERCPNEYSKLIKEKKKCISNCSLDNKYKYEFNNLCYEIFPEDSIISFSNISYEENASSTNIIEDEETPSDSIILSSTIIYEEDSRKDSIIPSNINYEEESSTDFNPSSNDAREEEKESQKDIIYGTENKENNKYIEYIDECNIIDLFKGKCSFKDDNPKTKDNIVRKIKDEITKGYLNSLLLNVTKGEKEDLIFYYNDGIYQITSTENQYRFDYYNVSTIILGECENILKDHYNISKKEPLIIFKIDYYEEGLLIPIVEYEFYNPETKEVLNLTLCSKNNIDILLPASIDEKKIYKYNPSSEFYNDFCYPYANENGADITLYDRRNDFNNNNLSVCESKCEYQEYISEKKLVKCECEVKTNMLLFSEIMKNKDKLFEHFTDIKNIMNIKVMKCFRALFNIEGIKNNLGNYILLSIIFINTCLFFAFLIKGLIYFIYL